MFDQPKWRDRECLQCGHKFVAAVKHTNATQNLTGEAGVQCPICRSKGLVSGPWITLCPTCEGVSAEFKDFVATEEGPAYSVWFCPTCKMEMIEHEKGYEETIAQRTAPATGVAD